ncbi:MAG: helix-turn-helix domain-containing protein, partial [Verrucomicrobia bacterium]|nr:helix-turn-helix domain-containing protein [Verrucomicrobiota bacterium]
ETVAEKRAFSVDASCVYLDVSRATLNRLMDSGKLRNLHIGRRRLILRDDLDEFLRARLAESEIGN